MDVGLYCAWDEPFEYLTMRLRWATYEFVANTYKSLRFVPPTEPHTHALVFNASETEVRCDPENTYVIVFEPPEILGEMHPWLTETGHPQAGANIYSFCEGSDHPLALALHLPQATIDHSAKKKTQKCAMICSNKEQTPWQKKRREVLRILREETSLPIDFYGRGMTHDPDDERVHGEILDMTKDCALRPYEYVIDFENTDRLALTDKFMDPILNLAVPITNSRGAQQIFPEGSFRYINFDLEPVEIVDEITRVLNSRESPDRWALHAARDICTKGEANICEWLHRKVTA